MSALCITSHRMSMKNIALRGLALWLYGENDRMTTITVVGDVMERVIAERQRRGWSQRRAAEHAGIDSAQWSRMERGLVEMSDRSRAAIAHAFDWPLDWPDVDPGIPVPSVSQYDALEERVRDLEAMVRALTRALLDNGNSH
jgi:transcriptional regulator with XRE-family HTH domain